MARTECREGTMLRLGTAQFRVSDRDINGTGGIGRAKNRDGGS